MGTPLSRLQHVLVLLTRQRLPQSSQLLFDGEPRLSRSIPALLLRLEGTLSGILAMCEPSLRAELDGTWTDRKFSTINRVAISFFPEAMGNVTYPSTYYATNWGVTM